MKFSAITKAGTGRGHKIGYPTINFDVSTAPPELTHGVYRCRVTFGDALFDGVIHYGLQKTFDGEAPTLEAHLFGFDSSKETEAADIEIFEKLRDVKKFDTIEELRKQIDKDIIETKRMLQIS